MPILLMHIVIIFIIQGTTTADQMHLHGDTRSQSRKLLLSRARNSHSRQS